MKTNLEMLNEAERDMNWAIENAKEIREKYEGKAIAIINKKIIASADSKIKLWRLLREKGIDDEDVFVKYISPKGVITIY